MTAVDDLTQKEKPPIGGFSQGLITIIGIIPVPIETAIFSTAVVPVIPIISVRPIPPVEAPAVVCCHFNGRATAVHRSAIKIHAIDGGVIQVDTH